MNDILYLAGILEESTSFEKKENVEFFKARQSGAKKIADAAKAKGGPSMLTYWHFQAKHQQYQEVITAVNMGRNKTFFQSKYNSFMSQLHKTKFEQHSFQVTIGQMEVWGEALAKLF